MNLQRVLVPGERGEALKQLFAVQHAPAQILIVGGGLTGLLLALRLSKERQNHPDPSPRIVLVDSLPSLGGRLYFSCPLGMAGLSAWERFDLQWNCAVDGKSVSGFGAEILTRTAASVLERHVESHLSEDELQFVESFVNQTNGSRRLQTDCFFVKKDFTRLDALLSGSSELLTKKEADSLAFLFQGDSVGESSVGGEEVAQPNGPKSAADLKGGHGGHPGAGGGAARSFEQTSFWAELPKNQKEALTPLLETMLGGDFLKAPTAFLGDYLHQIYASYSVPPTPYAARVSGWELALELVLRARGVDIRTSCSVTRIVHNETAGGFGVTLADEVQPARRDLFAERVCVTVPLAKAFSFLAREFFAPAQARFVAKFRPRSLVAAEYADFKQLLLPTVPRSFGPGTRFYFPVERVQAVCTSQGTLLFFTFLDFEDSLQAPAVREAISRLRKAAVRALSPDAVKALASGRRMPNKGSPSERIVLLPVGYAVPFDVHQSDLQEVRMARKGLYCCGDTFGFDFQPWKNVVDSVHEVATLLMKEGL